MQFAIMVMVTGAVIAGATDLTYSVPGYIWVAICAVSTAVYLLLIRLLKDKTGETSKGLHIYALETKIRKFQAACWLHVADEWRSSTPWYSHQ